MTCASYFADWRTTGALAQSRFSCAGLRQFVSRLAHRILPSNAQVTPCAPSCGSRDGGLSKVAEDTTAPVCASLRQFGPTTGASLARDRITLSLSRGLEPPKGVPKPRIPETENNPAGHEIEHGRGWPVPEAPRQDQAA